MMHRPLEILKSDWIQLTSELKSVFGDDLDLQGILFLIGVQELGKGLLDFSKEQKQDLLHIAVCRVLSRYGYYRMEGRDPDGWPQWILVEKIPSLSLKEQDLLLKEAVLCYFESGNAVISE